MKFMVLIHRKGLGNSKFILKVKHGLLNTKTTTKDMLNSCWDESICTTVQMCFYKILLFAHQLRAMARNLPAQNVFQQPLCFYYPRRSL